MLGFIHRRASAAGRWVLGAVLLWSLSSCRAVPSEAGADRSASAHSIVSLSDSGTWTRDVVLPLERHGAYLTVEVEIQGRAAGRWILDTGANRSVIDQGVAARLGLADVGGGHTLGAAGVSPVRYRGVSGLRFGSGAGLWVASESRKLIGLSLRDLGRRMFSGIGGIVSFRELGATAFTLDPAERTLTFHHAGLFLPPADAAATPLRLHQGLPVVAVGVDDGRGGTVWVDCLIDTGATGHVTLPESVLSAHPGVLHGGVRGERDVRGVGGRVRSRLGVARGVEVLGFDIPDCPVGFEPAAVRDANGQGLGRIGWGVLRHLRLTLDPRHHAAYAARVSRQG